MQIKVAIVDDDEGIRRALSLLLSTGIPHGRFCQPQGVLGEIHR